MNPALSQQQKKFTSGSPLQAYRELVAADHSLGSFIYYEICQTLFSNLPALPGLVLRSLSYPVLFESCGTRVAIGKGCVIRNPARINLGSKVLIDDYVTIDARQQTNIKLGDFTTVGRFSIIVTKSGSINLGVGVNIGTNCRIATQSSLSIGDSTLIAAFCYIGPGNHKQAKDGKAMIEQEMEVKGGVRIGSKVWIGAHSTIMDGVTIGDEAVIGAHSFVREDVPAGSVVAGVPAKIIRDKF